MSGRSKDNPACRLAIVKNLENLQGLGSKRNVAPSVAVVPVVGD
jgi:hypothetical protein